MERSPSKIHSGKRELPSPDTRQRFHAPRYFPWSQREGLSPFTVVNRNPYAIEKVVIVSHLLRCVAFGLCFSMPAAYADGLKSPFSPVDYTTFDQAVSGNPAATTFNAGTGWLGQALGIPEDSGVTFGGMWLADTNNVFSGGAQPGAWSSNSSLVLSLKFDAQKLWGWRGATFGFQYLNFYGQNTNGDAGSVQGYNGIVGTMPFQRNEFYQAWYLQEIIHDVLQVRLGKTTPTLDFNNVLRPLTLKDSAENIPSVSEIGRAHV